MIPHQRAYWFKSFRMNLSYSVPKIGWMLCYLFILACFLNLLCSCLLYVRHNSVFLWRQNQYFPIWITNSAWSPRAVAYFLIFSSKYPISTEISLCVLSLCFLSFLIQKMHISGIIYVDDEPLGREVFDLVCTFWLNIAIFRWYISSQGSKFPVAFSMISSFVVVDIFRRDHFFGTLGFSPSIWITMSRTC